MSEHKTSLVSALLLAAGKSERMGQNKLLLPWDGGTVLQRTLDNLLASRAGEVIVVLGSRAQEIADTIGDRKVVVVMNPNYARGMSTSLVSGLGMVSQAANFVLVALGDQPLITAHIYKKLIETALAPDKGMVVPTYQGERGNPILVSTGYRSDLLMQSGDIGGRELLKTYPDDVLEVPVDSESILVNINTKEEYEKRLKAL
jgi:molybdenum cofactor cytidylyltransferase